MFNKKLFVIIIAFFAVSFITSCDKINGPDGSTISGVVISSLQPTHGPGESIDTINGSGFDKIPTLDSIFLNGKRLTLISRSPTQVIVKIPALAGTGNIDIWYQGKFVRGPVFTYDKSLMVVTIAGAIEPGAADGQGLDARFNFLLGIAIDKNDNIYVADNRNSAIRKITPSGNVTTFAGVLTGELNYIDGTGSAARFASPWGLTIDADGFLYVGDEVNYRVRKISPLGVVTTFAGAQWDAIPQHGENDGNASIATFNTPRGVTVDKNGNVFVADINNNKIRKITAQGVVSSFAGGGYFHFGQTDGPGNSALFNNPNSVAADNSGNVFVIDGANYLIRKITPSGTVSTLLGPKEDAITGPYELLNAGALATDKNGNLFFSISGGIIELTTSNEIVRYAIGGVGENDGPLPYASFRSINGIAINNLGELIITDNNRVRKIAWQ